jgi:hypothetical protein
MAQRADSLSVEQFRNRLARIIRERTLDGNFA